jgi:hypothetical protein
MINLIDVRVLKFSNKSEFNKVFDILNNVNCGYFNSWDPYQEVYFDVSLVFYLYKNTYQEVFGKIKRYILWLS